MFQPEGVSRFVTDVPGNFVYGSRGFGVIVPRVDKGQMERFIYTGIEDSVARRLGDPPVGRGLPDKAAPTPYGRRPSAATCPC